MHVDLGSTATLQRTKENLTPDVQAIKEDYMVTTHMVDMLALGIHSFLEGW